MPKQFVVQNQNWGTDFGEAEVIVTKNHCNEYYTALIKKVTKKFTGMLTKGQKQVPQPNLYFFADFADAKAKVIECQKKRVKAAKDEVKKAERLLKKYEALEYSEP